MLKKILCLLLFVGVNCYAGFLEMPETEEVPELEEDTMLLDLDVPNVRERDPDPQGGPRLNVKEFRVQGIVEFPRLGITREDLIQRVESIRFDMMQEGELLDSGYTIDEIAEVSDLLGDIESETKGEHVTPVELQRLVFLIRDQRRKRGVTLGMIEAVADVITRYYRERGFILAKAYIPEQHVRDGVVTLTLLLGELGEVQVHENKRYSDRLIARTFNSAMGKPVTTKSVEERLYLINDMPGLSVRGYFEPGSQVGDTRLNVNTIQERRYDANVRVDNHGTDSSGKYRLYADLFLYNPTHTSDQLQIGVLGASEPATTTYGLIRYQTNIIHPRIQAYLGASSNEFVQDEFLDTIGSEFNYEVKGDTQVADAGLSYKLKRSRISNHTVDLAVNSIESDIAIIEATGGEALIEYIDKVRNTRLSYKFDVLSQKRRMLHQGTLSLTASDFVEGAEGTQELKPNIFNFDYAMLSFMRVPFSSAESRLLFRFSGQYAGVALASSMQYGLGGPTKSRGFVVNKFYGDDAAYMGVDWIFNGPGFGDAEFYGEKWRNIIQPYIFVDAGYGIKHKLREDTTDDTTAQLANAGLGIKFTFKSFRSNLIVGTPIEESIKPFTDNEPSGTKAYLDFQYSF